MLFRDRVVVFAAGLFLVAAAVGYASFRFGDRPRRIVEPQERMGSVVEEGAELVLRYVADGSVARSEVVPVSRELIGLSLTEVRGLRPEWTVLSFAPTRLVVEVPCAPEGPGGFIKEREGLVAIYSGVPDGCYKLEELTGLEVKSLPPEAQQAVSQGIEFDDRADLPQILEGLTSTR